MISIQALSDNYIEDISNTTIVENNFNNTSNTATTTTGCSISNYVLAIQYECGFESKMNPRIVNKYMCYNIVI